jgi:hypothetical protein
MAILLSLHKNQIGPVHRLNSIDTKNSAVRRQFLSKSLFTRKLRQSLWTLMLYHSARPDAQIPPFQMQAEPLPAIFFGNPFMLWEPRIVSGRRRGVLYTALR